MRTIRLGRTEVQVPAVSLGTWSHGGPALAAGRPVGWYGTSDREVHDTLVRSYRAGVNHWDTADVYGGGHSERLIGEIWSEVPRDEIFLASKVGWDPGPYDHFYQPEQMRRQLDASLKNLSTDRLDLYYFHHSNFGPEDQYLPDALEQMHRFRDEGKIRFIGLSDWQDNRLLRVAEKIDPDVIQVYRNVMDDTYEGSGLKAWSESKDIGVVFFSVLKHGLLLGELEGPATYGAGDHRNAIPDFRDFNLLCHLRACRQAMMERFARHPEPVLHALVGSVLSECDNACVLLGMRRAAHLRSARTTGEPLSQEDALWVRGLYQERPSRDRATG